MAPFEALYGRRCRTPLNWVKPGERMTFGPDLVTKADEIVHRIQSNLKVGESRQEHYANKRCRPLTLIVGDHMYLRVSPMQGVKRSGIKGKLAPRYICLFLILKKHGAMDYKLELSSSLAGVHDVFHVSQLNICLKVPGDVIVNNVTLLEVDLSYPEHPVKLLGQHDRGRRRRMIHFYKVQWSRHSKKKPRGRSSISFILIICIFFLHSDRRRVVTSLKFKHFICILIIVITFESNQIFKFRFEFKLNSRLRIVFEFSFKFCCNPVNMKVAPNVLIYLK
jgi:hypothetical protein